MDFAVTADGRVKIKESEKINYYTDLAREQKRMTVVLVEVGTLGIVLRGLEKKDRKN